ncbi:nucleotide exchange factor GrpE [Frisingicoccus sp.]|uniref:nucleotide exchange factor GrpE n=1 Tax=Frisingicoccus sp. TaxID=1918627 RepID=UPI002E9C71E1|nr:nucleotide exchange factor GrpE [Frisingicoccus sp.]
MAEQEKDMNEREMDEEIQTEDIDTTEAEAETAENAETSAEEAEESSEGAETSGQKEEKKKGFFNRDKKDKKDEKIAELNDRLMRQMAEFDNFRKRTEKEKQQMYGIGASEVIEKLLPIVDNFERGLAAMTDDEKNTPFAQGIELVYKQLMTTLSDLGVTPIEAVGVEFNPDFHNAVMQAPSEEYESGIVIQELQRGYVYKEKVIRYSMVMVAE